MTLPVAVNRVYSPAAIYFARVPFVHGAPVVFALAVYSLHTSNTGYFIYIYIYLGLKGGNLSVAPKCVQS